MRVRVRVRGRVRVRVWVRVRVRVTALERGLAPAVALPVLARGLGVGHHGLDRRDGLDVEHRVRVRTQLGGVAWLGVGFGLGCRVQS